jgi:hypothetical protein
LRAAVARFAGAFFAAVARFAGAFFAAGLRAALRAPALRRVVDIAIAWARGASGVSVVSVMVLGSPFAFRWGTAAPRADPRDAVTSGVRRGRTAGRAVRRAGVEAADRRRADPESRCAVPVAVRG